MKTDCIFAASISPYIDGELSAEDSERVRLHLTTCSACSNALKTLSAMDLQLAAMPPISPSADFDRHFWQKIEASKKNRRHPAWRQWIDIDRLRDWRPALATAAGVLILCGTLFFTQKPTETEFSSDEIVMAQNLELLTDYEIVSNLDLLEHWTDFSENDATDA